MIRHLLLSRVLVACLASAAFTAQAQQLRDLDAVSLERLSLMQGSPPPPEKVVNDANRGQYRQMRWALQHTRELESTRNIRHGGGAVSKLSSVLLPLEQLSFVDDKGRTLTLEDWLRETCTHPVAGAAFTHLLTLRAWDAPARAVQGDTKP